ncbi:hypothetical protein ONZ45_g17929 [Pleurotus djamor]|nr:hypothetical protein ONZ45_g17929 [Pleurotus djamor]
MKLTASTLVFVPLFAVAHNPLLARHAKVARQAPPASPSQPGSATLGAPGPTPPVASPATTSTPEPSVTLLATNPTAVPLTQIVSNAPTSVTIPLPTTFTAGSVPSSLPNAPPLPDAKSIVLANYPPPDQRPPTDSPEVKQWIAEVANSGVQIPNISATKEGGCPANTDILADDANRCWWTCGGCTRSSDITSCPDKMTWGLTYDDGPAFYTPNLLNYLDEKNLKATFFAVGSRIAYAAQTLQYMHMTGHEISVHTWAHPPLTTLTNEQIIAELGWTKKIIKDALGVTPLTFRPPYGDIDDRVRAIAKAMNLTPVMWTRIGPYATFDTDDFNIHGGLASSQKVLNNWKDIMGNVSSMNTGFIVLEHDLFQQSVEVATGYILPDALAHQPPFKIEPVTVCLNKPLGDAYLETNDNKTNPLPATAAKGSPGSAQATKASDAVKGSNGASSGTSLSARGVVTSIATVILTLSAL